MSQDSKELKSETPFGKKLKSISEGGIIKIPTDVPLHDSKNKKHFPTTPVFIRFFVIDGILRLEPKGLSTVSDIPRFILFVPGNCRGKLVIVKWKEINCACAYLKD